MTELQYLIANFSMTRLVSVIDWLSRNFSFLLFSTLRVLFSRSINKNPKTIIVLRNCFFGDFVVAVPALRLLRASFPNSKIIFVTASSFAPGWIDKRVDSSIFDIEPGIIDQIIPFNSKMLRTFGGIKALRSQLKSQNLALSIVLTYSSESILSRVKRIFLCLILGIPFPFGLNSSPTLLFRRRLNRWRIGSLKIEHQYQAAIGSVNELLMEVGRTPGSHIALADGIHQRIDSNTLYVGIAPFTKQNVKQWPLLRFAELMNKLAEVHINICYEIYGGEDDVEGAKEIVSMLSSSVAVTSYCGRISPSKLRDRLKLMDLLICLDSAPMHLASLIGTPVVAIFSQITLHQFWRPWGPNSILIKNDVSCAVCETRSGDCPDGTKNCINNISVDEVLGKALSLLKRMDGAR